MPPRGTREAAAPPPAPPPSSSSSSRARQFAAVLHKNVLLSIRGRRATFLGGVGGWPALLLQVALPALFFSLMCIPKYYIQPYEHPVFLQASEYDVDTRWWAGASPYEGPALAAGGRARIAFVPDTPEVASLVQRLAMAVSCPTEPYKRICSTASITSFACLFDVQPPSVDACQNVTACMMTPACYSNAVANHTLLLPDEAAVWALLEKQPHSLDAVVVFPQALAAAQAAKAAPAPGGGGQPGAPAAPATTSSHRAAAARHQGGTQRGRGSRQLVGCGAPGPPDGDGLLLDYVIRLNASDVPPTQLLQDLFDVSPGVMPVPGNLLWEYRRYWFFVNLQLAIDRALLGGQQAPGGFPAPLTVRVKPFPWPARQEDLGAASAAAFFNLLLVYAFMAPTRAVVGSIVREKELRLREGMRILGLSEGAYWWSWSVTHWATLAASGLLCAAVGLYPFRHSSLLLMLAFYWLFAAALISFSYFLSTLFSASRVAGTATQFIYALSMMPGFLLPFVRPYGGVSWYIAGLSPTSAASLFAAALVNWERLAAGVTLDTLQLPVTPDSAFCVASVCWLLAVDVVLFAVLTWYCDKVIPQPFGQTLPLWFPFTPAYWRSGSSSSSSSGDGSGVDDSAAGKQEQQEPLLAAAATPAASAAAPGASVQIRGLRKVFRSADGSTRVAVEGLSLDMHTSRITALLGHNGAGKTTCIHMLTGMLQPTSGTALIGGCDIRTSMAAIRHSLGICPQFDILWPDITVLEHLQLYAAIKGAAGKAAAADQAHEAAAEVGLSNKLDCLAAELSGGQRRKLSVAIAFLGNPAVVFLDEPTSGMDPYSRRATWDVIRRRRASAVIVLTTHSMEEADLLCDTIHIMAEGRLAASGTPLSLKAQYGVGYTLTAVLRHAGSSIARGGSSGSVGDASGQLGGQAADALLQLLQQHIPAAQLISAAGAEVSVRLPREAAAAFPGALRALDAAAGGCGVASYGLSVTTLEEVFLAIADSAVSISKQPASSSRPGLISHSRNSSKGGGSSSTLPSVAAAAAPGPGPGPAAAAAPPSVAEAAAGDGGVLSGAALYWQQFSALFVKRMLCARRDRLAVITQLLVPLLLVLLAMSVSTLETQQPQQPPLVVSRQTCLMGKPTLLAAAPSVRLQTEVQGFMDGYPRGDIMETGYTQLYHGSSGQPLNLTLDGQLLHQASSGSPHYDALFLEHMPPVEELLTSLAGTGPRVTLLVNQSAISGLPAALNQASSALLRLIVAAGGAKGSPASAPAPAAAAAGAAHPPLLASAAGGGSSSLGPAGSVLPGGGHLPSCVPVIGAVSSPLPLMRGEQAQRIRQDAGALMLVLCMTLAVSVLSASFVVFLVREADNNSKHLQMVSGAQPSAYWAANLCWDLLNFALPAAGIVGLVYVYNQPALSGIRLVAMALLLLAFSGAGITLTYLAHFSFNDEMKALQRLNTSYFLTGYLGFLTTWVLGVIARIMGRPGLATAAARAKGLLRLLSPHNCFAQGLYDISNTAPGAGVIPIPGLPHGPTNPFAYAVLGSAVLPLAAQTLVFGAAAVLVDVGLMQVLRRLWARVRPGSSGHQQHHPHAHPHSPEAGVAPPATPTAAAAANGSTSPAAAAGVDIAVLAGSSAATAAAASHADADVAAERRAVKAGEGLDEAMVVLAGISKSYFQGAGLPPVRALAGLWLRVWPGECFGLLGVNGAGKTTTFKILTGEVTPDAGDARVAHHSILTQLAGARQRLGYCPQHEALPAAMTAREVLTMYGRLRGVVGRDALAAQVDGLLQQLGLRAYADVACGAYSGGNKRKLSVAVALVGGPPLVLLDEPSTGMDPSARRFLWRVLQSQVLGSGRTIILTSHSMEEVEALASRLVIMAAGSARCCGTPQHLKNKFGDGYTLELRVVQPPPQQQQQQPGSSDGGGMSADGGSCQLDSGGSDAAALAAATSRAEQHFLSLLPGAVVLERDPGRLLLRLPIGFAAGRAQQGQAGVSSLADVFECVEAARERLGVSDYSLAQSSLERVFLALAQVASHS